MNLNETAFFQNPYPYYASMRKSDQPLWLPHAQESTSEGMWLFARYDDAVTLFRAGPAISKNISTIRRPGTGTPFDLHMLHRDAPDHPRLRRLVADRFSAQNLKRFESEIFAIVDTLVERMKAKGGVDLVTDFAEQVPLRIIGHLMGIPQEDIPQIRQWSLVMVEGFDSVLASADDMQRQRDTGMAFLKYFSSLMEAKRRQPGDDLLSEMNTAVDEGSISAEEALGMAGLLLVAGHETTVSLIGSGLLLLLNHPEQLDLVRKEPNLLAGALEETLRFESPAQRATFRIVAEPYEMRGLRLEPGQQLGIIIGAANRDESQFDNAAQFDIRRTPNRHLAFGLGGHNCLGQMLARLEGRIAISRLLEQCPALRLEGAAYWRKNSLFRSLHTLPATVA
ncbi:cytochrome P450 [Ramlibacter sp. WS9]|uniref:cytochrome P450 n=1 Tax=Ramlibacter sp. WS9 TaxID=1882741 RepID=UPI001141F61B|nr:cytochrome P450 [Ramlibacter sp. WS9]ROZ71527.1 cytochrome P450 [Ramlibacter sp. WS9]